VSTYVAIIPGHGSRPAGWDPGAVGVRQGDTGPEEFGEAALVRQMAPMVLHHLQLLGVGCGIHDAPTPCPKGHPAEHYRHRVAEGLRSAGARRVGRCVVLHLHLNAGGGRYGMTLTDSRSAGCGAIGAAIDAQLRTLAGITAPGAAPTMANFPRSTGLIETVWREGKAWPGITSHALVCEPAFVDQPLHQPLLAGGAKPGGSPHGLNAIAAAIARGIAGVCGSGARA